MEAIGYNELYELWKEADREATEAAKRLGLAQAVDMYVLFALALKLCVPQPNILARYVRRAPTSFTSVLDRLTGQGYIQREEGSLDRRAKTVTLTIEGEALALRLIAEVGMVEGHVQLMTGALTNGKSRK